MVRLPVLLSALALAGTAVAQAPIERPPGDAPATPPAPVPRREPAQAAAAAGEEPGYCRYVRGAAASEAAVLYAPELFGTVGAFQIAEGDTGTAFGEPRVRVTLGAEASLSEIFQGVAVRQHAEAECRRWRAMNALEGALQAGEGIGAGPALAARAAVLAEALPLLDRRLGQLRDQVKLANATVEELDAAQLRADGLRELAARTAIAMSQARESPAPSSSLSDLLGEYRAADDEVERLEGRLRKSEAWDLRLRGGYDEIVDVDQDLPIFAALTLSYDLGNLWQHAADRGARRGREEWIREEATGVDTRIAGLIESLRTTYEVERSRLAEVETLKGDLEGQLRIVESLETSHVRRFRDYLHFELTRVRAEHAYLREHVGALRTFLGDGG